MMLDISVSDPLRITSAVSAFPDMVIARRKPSAIERTPRNTPTTPAIPKIADADEPTLWPMVRTLKLVSATICLSQFKRASEGRGRSEPARLKRGRKPVTMPRATTKTPHDQVS
jgi:hypothetical protein